MNIDLSGKKIVVTGGAGFIGSNLCEILLDKQNKVICLDNFSTGKKENISPFLANPNFILIEGDIRNLEDCKRAVKDVDYVLHQAALGSVPRSIKDPITTNDVNISGFLNMLVAAKEAKVKRFVYAASSSTYGDSESLPKVEDIIGKPLSPYAVTKYVNELYADVFDRSYGFKSIGLRYFNVFGQRQNPNGAYAAVIPKWTSSIIKGDDIFINGDGSTSRDFCFIENAVQANILAATADIKAKNQIYNCAVGDRTNLNELFSMIKKSLIEHGVVNIRKPIYRDFRPGDVMHSQADISKAMELLGYLPEWRIEAGIANAMPWYIKHLSSTL